MSRPDPPEDDTPTGGGATTAVGGTAFPVDVSGDRRQRSTLVVLVAGPVIWFTHFMVVYLVAEAGCTGDGPGLEVFDPPVPTGTTIAATVVAVLACGGSAASAYRRWRADRPEAGAPPALTGDIVAGGGRGTIAFTGLLLSLFSIMAILLVGLPALFLPPC